MLKVSVDSINRRNARKSDVTLALGTASLGGCLTFPQGESSPCVRNTDFKPSQLSLKLLKLRTREFRIESR